MTGISITVNGMRDVTGASNLAQLLAERQIDAAQPFIAVAVNNEVVPRNAWANLNLADGDRIEIVQPMKGG